MKKIIEKMKNLFPDKNKKIAAYFIFYFIFFLFVLLFVTTNNFGNKDKEECKKENNEVVIDKTKNYGFRFEIEIDGNSTVLSGSRYNNKIRIDKRIEGLLTKYYIYYTDIYILNEENKWIKYDDKILEGLDEKLIDLEYISEIIKESELIDNNNKKIRYSYEDDKIIIELNIDSQKKVESLRVIKGTTNVVLKYFDEGEIEDFKIEIEE